MTSESRIVKHLFIINPNSFRHKWKQDMVIADIHKFFNSIKNNNYHIHFSRFPRDATGFIPFFAGDLPREITLRVYAVGGDGILFDCLNGIMDLENAELAAIPYGRTNNFIRGFGKNNKSLFRSIPLQYGAPAVPMDVIRCGNNYALDYCIAGMEADALRRTLKIRERMENGNTLTQWLSRRLYTFLYLAGAFATYLDGKLLHRQYDVEIDGKTTGGFLWTVSVFNGSYYGGSLHPVNNAMPNDGILDILLIRGRGGLKAFFLLPFYLSGRYKKFPRIFTYKQGGKINIRSDSHLIVSMDDQVFCENELAMELLPSAVNFVDAGRQGYKGGGDDRTR